MAVASTPPDWADTLTEPWRAGLEATRLAMAYPRLLRAVPKGEGASVLVLPSYGTGDAGTLPLRRFLKRIGYRAPRCGLGTNLDFGDLRIRRMEDAARFRALQGARVRDRVEALVEKLGEPVSLVGWSLGGLFALDVSQQAPEAVRSVVTLGSPFGDPRGTSLFDLMRRLNQSSVPVEEQDFGPWMRGRQLETQAVPITVVHSQRDGIVGPEVGRLPSSPCVRHVSVESSHLGFAANPQVFEEVAIALADDRTHTT